MQIAISFWRRWIRSRNYLTDLKTPEERITEIAPSIVHGLIKSGKIEEKKVDLALKELEKIFGANVATYYGVLLLINWI